MYQKENEVKGLLPHLKTPQFVRVYQKQLPSGMSSGRTSLRFQAISARMLSLTVPLVYGSLKQYLS